MGSVLHAASFMCLIRHSEGDKTQAKQEKQNDILCFSKVFAQPPRKGREQMKIMWRT